MLGALALLALAPAPARAADLVFSSPDGYTLVVPDGYAYTAVSSGAISMAAVKKQAQSAIVVARQQGREGLEDLAREALKVLRGRNSTWAFSSALPFSIGDKKAIRVNIEVEKQGVPLKGIYVFVKAGDTIFSVMMSCPASVFSQESLEFEKVIRSFKLR